MFKNTNKDRYIHIYYIPTNVISLNTVDSTECDPMLRITTLWFSESISPLSETDDVRSTHCFSQYTMHEVLHDVIHIARYKMKPTNPMHLFDAIRIIFNSRPCSVFIVRIEILTIVIFKMCFALVNIIRIYIFKDFRLIYMYQNQK